MTNTSDLNRILQEIYERHGMLTPELFKEEARAEAHPCHTMIFDCPSEEAAERYYTNNARHKIKLSRIKIEVPDDPVIHYQPAWYAIPASEPDQPAYVWVPAEEVKRDADLFAAARQEAVRQLKGASNAVRNLDRLEKSVDAQGAVLRAQAAIESAHQELQSIA